ncbi:MAG: zinc ABC transporter substrate-binding protein [bacterium]|nr:zinc ABC transporter substrate-binding protein [bacterium]
MQTTTFKKKFQRWFRWIVLGSALWAIFSFGCQPTVIQGEYVLTTTGMIADLVRQVAQDQIQVISLMGPGVDPHLYKPTEGDLIRIKHAKAIFVNGLHLEGRLLEIFERQKKRKPVLAISDAIPKDSLIALSKNTYDPHLWHDPVLWKMAIPEITKTLIGLFPKHQLEFEKNAQLATVRLDSLHRWIVEQLENIPPKNRILVTSHDAFLYFGKRYQIEVHGLQGSSTVSEYGLQDITRMVDFIVMRKIPAVFVESSVPTKAMNAVIEGAKKKNVHVQLGGILYSDAMGKEGTAEGTYEGMIRANVLKIKSALMGERFKE